MKSPLNTRKLQALCEAVARDSKGYNEGTIPKAQDEDWARLTYESLPALEAFISEENSELTHPESKP